MTVGDQQQRAGLAVSSWPGLERTQGTGPWASGAHARPSDCHRLTLSNPFLLHAHLENEG